MAPSLRGPIATLLCALPALAQNPTVDLNLWTVEHINGAGTWLIDAPRLFTDFTNNVNTDVSVLHSDFQVSQLDFRMSVDPSGGDDDIIGFVLGWNPGDSSNPNPDYVLVDWKKTTQTYQDWGTANEGLALSHVTGPFTRGFGGGPIDLWSHTGVCTELARGNTYGQTGWAFGTDYHFRVIFTTGTVFVWVNEQLEFNVSGTFNTGRFGCYNFSQNAMAFQFPLPGAMTAFGSGCPGSGGTPYLFSPVTPFVGRDMPVIIANLPPAAAAILVLGASDTSWQGTPLPLALGALGAPGCTAYISGDVFLPVTNFNGTAYYNLAIPSTIVPTTGPAFFLQGMAADPPANALGLVVSNAGAVTIGIR